MIEKISGKKESAIDNGIYFVKSPFKIEHKATAEYFKPALPFMVKVQDKTPFERKLVTFLCKCLFCSQRLKHSVIMFVTCILYCDTPPCFMTLFH